MGRPEPCVLFAQTFVHPQLDEYVDEVLFAEPVVITACEFLEQNASSTSRSISLVGATSPPSFALEVFVQCEGDTRFRRLCQPFLYSHSSSNVLEVEAVVTNHLVVRGSYRSLSLVIYGNTAEDLGQFNIEFDDSSLTDLVSFADGKLEDLPLALRTIDRTIEESLSLLNILSLPAAALDVSLEVKQLLNLVLKILNMPNLGSSVHKVVHTLVSATSSYIACEINDGGSNHVRTDGSNIWNGGIDEAKKELSEIYEALQQEVVKESIQSSMECIFMESNVDCSSSKQLVNSLCSYFSFSSINHAHHELQASESVILGLTLALFLCSGRDGCFQFVSCGGMDHLAQLFTHDILKSNTITLLLLGVVEHATRHSVGCEGFLGWWPREDENVPSGASERYNHLLKLLLQKPRHDIASLATYVLHRLRFYEVASRYEHAVLSMLGNSSAGAVMEATASDMLVNITSLLKKLLHLITTNSPIEDPSPAAHAERLLLIGQSDGISSYKATSGLISSSSWRFLDQDIDSYLLVLLKERGFLPLSAAVLSTPIMHSAVEDDIDVFMDFVSSIGLIILSLLFCRSGLIFLLQDPELIATVIYALKGTDDMNKEECVPLRYASVLMSKGFTCSSCEVGIILEMHLRVVNAIDRLLISTLQSEEFLWVLWELCGLSRSGCGRQALLALSYFPEAVSILIEALHCAKESEVTVKTNGATPLNLAILHSAAEIFELLVMDSSASSMHSWIGHAMELHKALHSSSPGSNRKDAPTRLLEWSDAGLVYHKNGAIGLLRYAALLVSGGDAQLTSTNIPVSDLTDGDNAGESSTADVNVIDNLAKIIYEKSFDGVNLRDSAITQLTTAFRILAYITENSAVAAALYDEGAISVIYAVLVNCSFMLERTSSSYDYLVDDGTECHSTSDILLERNREQSLVDVLVPCLLLLNTLLQKLQQVQEQHRNTKLMNVLLRLHREVSPKLAACAADLSSPYPDSALGFEAVCHLVVSALAYWPVNGWTPGLFHSLLASVQAASFLALGPKETCSLLCLLNDLFPEEGVWLWKNGMPLLSALRTLAIGTLLGPQKEKQVNWYLECKHVEKILNQLTPQLDNISQVIQNYAVSALVVIQDMLRVFLVRIAAQKAEFASKLIRPIILWMQDFISESASPLDTDSYKAYRFLAFMAHLLEHPYGKVLLIGEGVVEILTGVVRKCLNAICSERKQLSDGKGPAQYGFSLTNWCLPVFRSISHLVNSGMSLQFFGTRDLHQFDNLSSKDCSLFLQHILKFCQVLPIGKELLCCLLAFQDLVSYPEGRSALASALHCPSSALEECRAERECEKNDFHFLSDSEWRKCPPLLCCWTMMYRSVESKDGFLSDTVEAIYALAQSLLCFCIDGKSVNVDSVAVLKFLCGIPDDNAGINGFPEDNINYFTGLYDVLSSICANDCFEVTPERIYQVAESVKLLLLLLQKPCNGIKLDDISDWNPTIDVQAPSIMRQVSSEKVDDHIYLGGLGEWFSWELPETLPDRLAQTGLPIKRRMPQVEGSNRRGRENSVAEISNQNTFPRGSGPSAAPSGASRRDTFRQRKPNTSRPPSMHVDDYVARERSVDAVGNSNVISIHRVGSGGGRPPSIHVDEFMARQRERQNPPATSGSEPYQTKNITTLGNNADTEKANKPKQLKTDLDDDLQGIDIVFDGEESETDDRLPFLQPDDNLQQPAPVMAEQRSPHSVVEETESDANESHQYSRMGTPLTSNAEENAQSEFSSKMSISRPERLTREPSVSSDKRFFDPSDDSKNAFSVKNLNSIDQVAVSNSSGFSAPVHISAPMTSLQMPVDSRMVQNNFYPRSSLQYANSAGPGSRGIYDQKVSQNQPPLPPMPPPSTFSSVQSEHLSGVSGSPILPSSLPVPDSKFTRTSMPSPGGSTRLAPPLPSTPPPITSSSYNMLSSKATNNLVYNQANAGTHELPSGPSGIDARFSSLPGTGPVQTSYPPSLLIPSLIYNRPASIPGALYGNTLAQQQADNPPGGLQNPPLPQLLSQSMQSLAQLQPLQQLQRPMQPAQHLRPAIQTSQQTDQGLSLQTSVQIQMQQLQMLQQPQLSSVRTFYQSRQQEFSSSQQKSQVELAQPQTLLGQGGTTFQQQQDSGMSLHEYFQSPEAIQALLSDRDKLCQLLEQHPKLMQMLQEKLGQL